MGKAAVDLPDPPDRPAQAAPDAPANVDDLLAQMAGDEIDRLLSEADEPHAKPAAPKPVAKEAMASRPIEAPQTGANATNAAQLPSATAVDPEVDAQLDELYAQLDSHGAAASAAVVPPGASEPFRPTEVAAAITSKEKFIATQPSVADGVRVPAAEKLKPPVTDPPPPKGASAQDAVAATAEAMSAEERAALSMGMAIEDPAAAVDEADTAEEQIPVLLTPLAGGPEWLRELAGKLALLTLFNAAAVLVYVFLFRKH